MKLIFSIAVEKGFDFKILFNIYFNLKQCSVKGKYLFYQKVFCFW